jgi:uncharacterized RDD family membrane protein YckC
MNDCFMSEISAGLEQERPQDKIRYAGFWIRFGAQVIDAIIMIIIALPVVFISAMIFVNNFDSSGRAGRSAYLLIITVFAICLTWLYQAGFESSRYMATPGKLCFGIAVTDMEGNRISFSKASLRYVFKTLIPSILRSVSDWLSCLAFIYCAGDALLIVTQENKQSFHDIIAGTLVVYKERE